MKEWTSALFLEAQRLKDEGVSARDSAVRIGISEDRIKRKLGGADAGHSNGTAAVGTAVPVSEGAADALNDARASEFRARQARAEADVGSAQLKQLAVERELLRFVGDNPGATDGQVQAKFDSLLKEIHEKDLSLLEQTYAADLAKQTDLIEQLRARSPGTESELVMAMPAIERLGVQIVDGLERLGDKIGSRADRVEVQLFSRLPPSGLPSIPRPVTVNPDRLLDDLIRMTDSEVTSLGATLLGSEAAGGFAVDDLRLKLCEVAKDQFEASKPPDVDVTQWPNVSAMPLITQLVGLLQGLNLPDFRLGSGGQAGGAQPLTAERAPDGAQPEEAHVDVLRLRCPQCGTINTYDLNALRGSQSRYEPCACGILIDLSSHVGGETKPHLPRYRAS